MPRRKPKLGRPRKIKKNTVMTAIRGLPIRVKDDYRLMAAQVVKDTGRECSMNELYVRAMVEFIDRPENQALVQK